MVDVLRETGLPAERLTLEMTESVLLDKGEETLATLARSADWASARPSTTPAPATRR